MVIVVAVSLGVLVGGAGAGLGAALLVVAWRHRPRRGPEIDATAAAARLLVLVGAGMPLGAALASSAEACSLPALHEVVRRSRRIGLAPALASSTGALSPLLRRLAHAALSGAPLEPAIRSFIDSERRRRFLRATERARRLPVRLMVPMTLLVLPGFVLMVYGPALVGLVSDMLGPLGP